MTLVVFLTMFGLIGWILYMFLDAAYAELRAEHDLLLAEMRAVDSEVTR